jgi:polyhydroxybutyrate depolymerase
MGTRVLMMLSVLGMSCQKVAPVTGGLSSSSSDAGADADADADAEGSAGCGASPDGLATTLTIGDQARSFVLGLPDDYDSDQPYPLVLAWHGLGGSGALAASYFGLGGAAGSDAVVVYPSALVLPEYDGKTGWNLNPNGYDFTFFDDLYVHLTDNLCIDEGRVFSTGHSFGGYMSNSMGCYRGHIFNAIAPVAGGPSFWYGPCSGSVAARVIHGSDDDVVSLSEGQASVVHWRNSSECSGATAATAATGAASCIAFEGCFRDVDWCEHGGGHEWPWFAASAVWDFFSAQ